MSVVSLVVIESHLSSEAEEQLEALVRAQIAATTQTRSARQAVLMDLCDALARKPRIQASLEDDALDLLYSSAHNELRQTIFPLASDRAMAGEDPQPAHFYRFLDHNGQVIPPQAFGSAGALSASEEARLSLSGVPQQPLFGYISTAAKGQLSAYEVLTVPIISTTTQQSIAALVVGFPFTGVTDLPASASLVWNLLLGDELLVSKVHSSNDAILSKGLKSLTSEPAGFNVLSIEGEDVWVVARGLEQTAPYPAAIEYFTTDTSQMKQQLRTIRKQISGGGLLLLAVALLGTHFISLRLAQPVEALAEASEAEHVERIRVEKVLDQTNRELDRTARFSADASHQLKTPISVLRIGLEELLNEKTLPQDLQPEIADLIKQTDRLTTVIDELLLLSKIDAGHLQLNLQKEDLAQQAAGLVDDFSILPNPLNLEITFEQIDGLFVVGERHYIALILQNLLENAYKYNRVGGVIEIRLSKRESGYAEFSIGNTGPCIPSSSQATIFERFHRGAMGEKVPGYGLGLNLARDLARLHRGDLVLRESRVDWTEFVLTIPLVKSA